jgi:hypothetical protein
MDGDDVRVVETGGGPSLADETLDPLRVLREVLWQDFDGDLATQACVARPVDFAHPATTERRDDFIPTDLCAGREAH